MKTHKIGYFVIGALVLSLTACGGGSSSSSTTASQISALLSGNPTTDNILSAMDLLIGTTADSATAAAFDAAMSAYAAAM